MPLAITLLVLLAAACALTSAIPQHETTEWYREQYGERRGSLIVALYADDAYHSWWFLTLSGALCLSLLMCNLTRIRPLIRRTKEAQGGKAGIWGAWVCHLGILLLIVGFTLSQMTQREYTVAGRPGQTHSLEEIGLHVTVDDFTIDWRDDGSAGQYTTDLTVSDMQGRTESGSASVNHPAVLLGYEFFQNSAGWAADATVVKNGKVLQKETLSVKEYFALADDPDIVVMLYDFYPNYDGGTGTAMPMASAKPDHPGYLYMVFYRGEMRGMNVLGAGEELTIDQEYTVTFDRPSNYTVLVVKQDRFDWIVIAGAAVVLAGLIMAFYLRKKVDD